jgi:hypothetical protein
MWFLILFKFASLGLLFLESKVKVIKSKLKAKIEFINKIRFFLKKELNFL